MARLSDQKLFIKVSRWPPLRTRTELWIFHNCLANSVIHMFILSATLWHATSIAYSVRGARSKVATGKVNCQQIQSQRAKQIKRIMKSVCQKSRVLIVEDDTQVRQALVRALTLENYDVVAAADSQEALQKGSSTPIDAALFDLDRPDQHRWQTIRFLTAKNPSMSAIGMTARGDQHSLALAARLQALLEKPFDVPFLLSTLSQILGSKPSPRGCASVRDSQSTIDSFMGERESSQMNAKRAYLSPGTRSATAI